MHRVTANSSATAISATASALRPGARSTGMPGGGGGGHVDVGGVAPARADGDERQVEDRALDEVGLHDEQVGALGLDPGRQVRRRCRAAAAGGRSRDRARRRRGRSVSRPRRGTARSRGAWRSVMGGIIAQRRRRPRSVDDFHLTTSVDKMVRREDGRRAHHPVPGPGPAGHPAAAGDLPAAPRRRHPPHGRVALRGGPHRDAHHLAQDRVPDRPRPRGDGRGELLDIGTGSIRVDPNVEHAHQHLVCTRCGTVRDVLLDIADLRVPPRYRRGFTVEAVEVVFRGVCDDASPASPSTPERPSPSEPNATQPNQGESNACPT